MRKARIWEECRWPFKFFISFSGSAKSIDFLNFKLIIQITQQRTVFFALKTVIFEIIVLLGIKAALHCLGLVSITWQMPRPRHKNKAIIRLTSHPSRKSLCFDSKLVVVVVVIGLMETRLYEQILHS